MIQAGSSDSRPRPAPRGALRCALAALALATLGGCSAISYYTQALAGESSMLSDARPVTEVIADPATPPEVRERLRLAARIRAFAAQDLALPDNASYKRYTDLHRASAVWNVFATPELSLTLKTWCYPLFGCAAYRGYFAPADAEALAAQLRRAGLDAYVAPVPAYSTLGWFSDPLLSTFIDWPEPELARLIFHELAHQVVYVSDDTRFNEGFATAVEQAGLQRWVAARGDPALAAQYARYRRRHADFLELIAGTGRALQEVYASGLPPDAQRRRKREVFEELQARYRAVRDERWDGYKGLDAFFDAPWNNARVASLAAYEDDVPAFEALLAREHGDMKAFYTQVRKLGELRAREREAALRALAQGRAGPLAQGPTPRPEAP